MAAMSELTGKVAIVTGGVRGLGRQIAAALHAAGADVAITGRDAEAVTAAADEIGPGVLPVVCDIRDEQAVDGLAPAVLDRFGRIDILVNNSGIAGPTVPLWETSPSEWRDVIDTNVLGTFLCCRAVLPTMVRQRSGSVVNIGSATGKRPIVGRTSYAASKTALIGLTRTLATEAGPHGIRVNLVSPGAIDSDRFHSVVDAMAASQGVAVADLMREVVAGSPLGRLVRPEQVTDVVTFLAGDGAGGITGEDINVSAGLVMY